jgi:hypothetical protein
MALTVQVEMELGLAKRLPIALLLKVYLRQFYASKYDQFVSNELSSRVRPKTRVIVSTLRIRPYACPLEKGFVRGTGLKY